MFDRRDRKDNGEEKEEGGHLPLVVWLKNRGKGNHNFAINFFILPHAVHNKTEKNCSPPPPACVTY